LALARAQDDAYPRAECLLGVINGLLTLMEKR
jgi:hypothetical protein